MPDYPLAKELLTLHPNYAQVGILWAGGWDDYLVDTSVLSEATEGEIASYQSRIDRGWGGTPTETRNTGLWLRINFISPGYFTLPHLDTERVKALEPYREDLHKLVSVARHLGVGD